ncbi:PAS domain S-box protein [Thermodesulfobacteriota bacterium]
MTEQKIYNELEQRELEMALDRLFNLSVDMLCVADSNAYFRHINKAFEKTLGYSKDELLRETFINFIHPDDRASTMAEVEKLSHGEPTIYFENRYHCKDGSYKWLAWTAMPDPELGMMYAVARDNTPSKRVEQELQKARDELEQKVKDRTVELEITNENLKEEINERKRIEKVLRGSEERYKSLTENAPDIIYIIGNDGSITYVNPAWEKILGHKKDEVIGKYVLDFMTEEDVRDSIRIFKRVREGEEVNRDLPITFINKNGTRRLLNVTIAPYYDSNGVVNGVVALTRDITEHRKLESQLRQSQKMEAIGTLAGGIAHNFNNLLMGIQGYSTLMLTGIESDHPHYQSLKKIEQIVKSGSKLTDQLLGYAREGRYEVKPINLNRLVEETSDTFCDTRKEITINRDLDENLLGIEADLGQIEQVLMNLYINAADAMPMGGDLFIKTVNITHEDMEGKPYKAKKGNYVFLMVRDTGIGMERETIDRIFEPFFTTKGSGRGTGLGLASVYGIIKAHAGYIDVSSEKNKGTTFEIYLPASAKEIKKEKEFEAGILMGKGTILFIDDEALILDVAKQLLEKLGYGVIIAKSGREALNVLEKGLDKIDMVILDMIMPDLGGGETYDLLKEINPEIKVLLSSGYSVDGQAQEILNRGCNGFIQKPFKLEDLSKKIREILDRK